MGPPRPRVQVVIVIASRLGKNVSLVILAIAVGLPGPVCIGSPVSIGRQVNLFGISILVFLTWKVLGLGRPSLNPTLYQVYASASVYLF